MGLEQIPYFLVWAPAFKWVPGLQWELGQKVIVFQMSTKKKKSQMSAFPKKANHQIIHKEP